MKHKLLIFLILTLGSFVSCTKPSSKKTISNSQEINTNVANSERAALLDKEKASFEDKADNIGNLVGEFEFNVRTNKTEDFENGIIPWANLSKPETDINQIVDKDTIIISQKSISIIIDYPLTTPFVFTLNSDSGFSRKTLLREIAKKYAEVYKIEEETSSIKTIPIKDRKMMNRNQTNGKFGIWGHDLSDLDLSGVTVYETDEGKTVLTLNIES
jgi:hypothetical protein